MFSWTPDIMRRYASESMNWSRWRVLKIRP